MEKTRSQARLVAARPQMRRTLSPAPMVEKSMAAGRLRSDTVSAQHARAKWQHGDGLGRRPRQHTSSLKDESGHGSGVEEGETERSRSGRQADVGRES
jgi:hypothetical protein